MPAVSPSAAARRRHDLLTAHLPAAVWLIAMTIALAAPSNTADLPSWWPRILHFQALDKVIHGILFTVAAALLVRSFRRLRWLARPALLAFLAAAAYGGVTEIGQHTLTDRQGEVADVGADVAGAALGAGLAYGLGLRRRPAAGSGVGESGVAKGGVGGAG